MYTYYHPITVRYRDLDHQGHVNNAVYLTYLESARLGYYEASGIWQADSGKTTGMVVARIEIDYLAPIFPGEKVRVGLRILQLGTKSMTFEYQIESGTGSMIFARGKSIMVTYDNQKGESIPIPDDWREKITRFESQEEHNETT